MPSPDDAIETFILPDGYAINCFASEQMFPELANPIAMTFDDRGRLWVAVSPTYPHLVPGEKPDDKLLVLEDTDGDGVADRSTVFADGLYIPTGFVLSRDGALCATQSAPSPRSRRGSAADERTIVLHDRFGGQPSFDVHTDMRHDGAIYLNEVRLSHPDRDTMCPGVCSMAVSFDTSRTRRRSTWFPSRILGPRWIAGARACLRSPNGYNYKMTTSVPTPIRTTRAEVRMHQVHPRWWETSTAVHRSTFSG